MNTGRGSKSKALDIGYIINFEISTKEKQNIHKMRNIHIISEFHHENKSFSLINSYITFLATLGKRIPEGVPNHEIFEIVEKINVSEFQDDTKIILANLKVINIAGELSIENPDVMVTKILKFIHTHKLDDILRLSGIDDGIKEKLIKIIH